MTVQIQSSNNSSSAFITATIKPSWRQSEFYQNYNEHLTPEQKNTLQQDADDKIAAQVEKVKSNYQTAKDIDLMQSYYQQQQKLFDVYLQTSTDDSAATVESPSVANSSAVSTLTATYAELYQLHQTIKEGVGQLPRVSAANQGNETELGNSVIHTNEAIQSTASQSLTNKQLDAYNSLMMPSTASYVHLSA
ncbi:hypothetical protein [Colwellia psychrerythraea]|uniref:Uncharacterized protein n=1 Tax=Colwellia psychrerythraea TaxID=28229 RepID=A0A099L0V4_COLPS|nr:hypothetical protein [Colwellia psychrerythraea]KGJ95503.1 hypothetical protein ND2E_1285 [Colwellia psychrerythraea]